MPRVRAASGRKRTLLNARSGNWRRATQLDGKRATLIRERRAIRSLLTAVAFYDQATGKTPESQVPGKELKTGPACSPDCGCGRKSRHLLPPFAAVLHLLPIYASERGTRPKNPTMTSKDFQDAPLPLYAPSLPDYSSRHTAAPENGALTLSYSIHAGPKVIASGIGVFEKDS
jgi:hypothetical protein